MSETNVDEYGVPLEFYKQSWEDAEYPMACVGLDNRFIRVNHAFERLLGYSDAELRGRTWMSITKQEHIGGDLASMKAVIDGRSNSYRLEKDYIHKRGHNVPIELTVRRFPKETHIPVAMFRVEAPIESATRQELRDVDSHAMEAIAELRKELERVRSGIVVNQHVGNEIKSETDVRVGDNNSGFDQVGRDKSSNSERTIRFLMACLFGVSLAVAYMFYYVTTVINKQPVEPPKIEISE